ncbi:MAG: SMC-Scp complex subunit ScpB [Deltaproteobacteria bacterium]|nr:SMC-Scp complex subunit ScpB [Deltaproteobacteria bacterium]
MNARKLKSVIEGLIFASSDPLSPDSIRKAVPDASRDAIKTTLDELESEYSERDRGFNLIRVEGGYQFRSLPEIAPWIQALKDSKPWRFSRAALETLAIIAYNQPVTKNKIEQIRGVESSSSIKNLIERELITVIGRDDIPGRPLLYATTKIFLQVFGLNDLSSLPPLPATEEPDL